MRNANAQSPSVSDPKFRRDMAFRDVSQARRSLRLASQRFGAIANAGGSKDPRYTSLAEAAEQAARDFVAAEKKLAEADAVLAAFLSDDVRAEAV